MLEAWKIEKMRKERERRERTERPALRLPLEPPRPLREEPRPNREPETLPRGSWTLD